MSQSGACLPQTSIPPEVIADFGSSLIHVEWQLNHFLDEKPASIKDKVQALISSIPSEMVREHARDRAFRFLHQEAPDSEQDAEARREITGRLIAQAVNRERANLLQQANLDSRPPPYNHPSLADLPITDDHLIQLLHFASPRLLERGGFAFELAPTLPAFNSSYWLMKNLALDHPGLSKAIRLDPLCVQPLDAARRTEYKMWVYGVPLDWGEISTLKQEQHGRWMPGPLSTQSAFTDVVWSPRSSEVHFVCEEVPTADQAEERGARYLHSIFIPDSGHFIHTDGALRYYSPEAIAARLQTHVRKAGKAGRRVKIFLAEGDISTEVWSALVSSFFVWNSDVMQYLAGESAFPPQPDKF